VFHIVCGAVIYPPSEEGTFNLRKRKWYLQHAFTFSEIDVANVHVLIVIYKKLMFYGLDILCDTKTL